jgi:hypothetical protein
MCGTWLECSKICRRASGIPSAKAARWTVRPSSYVPEMSSVGALTL